MSNEMLDWFDENKYSVKFYMDRINSIRKQLDELEKFTRNEFFTGTPVLEDLDQKTIDSGFEN